jgi:hypothetical protein
MVIDINIGIKSVSDKCPGMAAITAAAKNIGYT